MCFSQRQLVFQWVPTVLLFWSICCIIHSYESDFIPEFIKKNETKLVLIFNLTCRYINDVISLNNSKLDDYLDCIYPTEVEINDTIEIPKSLLHTRQWQSWPVKSKTLRQKRRFLFFLVNVFFPNLYVTTFHNCISTCIWSMYLSVDILFQCL